MSAKLYFVRLWRKSFSMGRYDAWMYGYLTSGTCEEEAIDERKWWLLPEHPMIKLLPVELVPYLKVFEPSWVDGELPVSLSWTLIEDDPELPKDTAFEITTDNFESAQIDALWTTLVFMRLGGEPDTFREQWLTEPLQ